MPPIGSSLVSAGLAAAWLLTASPLASPGEAQDLPRPKKLAGSPDSSPAGRRTGGAAVPAPSAAIVVSADIDARIRVDGDRVVVMHADDVKTLPVGPGDHLLTLVSSDGALRKQLAVHVAQAGRTIVTLTAAGELQEARSGKEAAEREKRAADAVVERANRYARAPWIDLAAADVRVGCVSADTHCLPDERLPRTVHVEAFQMMATEVTVAAFDAFVRATGSVMPPQPAWSTRPDMPVVNITWTAARDFCASLDARLPTEAEWELAARADGGGIYPWGDVFVAGAANVSGQAADREWVAAAPVASFPPMRSGLFDLIGNVWEWSADASGPFRIIKGGGFSSPAALARISLHGRMSPTAADETVGCRCVRQRRKP